MWGCDAVVAFPHSIPNYDASMPDEQTRLPIVIAYGTRPEAIKMAPVVLALRASPWLRPVVVVSGQHREMLDQVNAVFGIIPDHDFDIIKPGQSLTGITTRALTGYSTCLDEMSAEAVVVQGDTTTTLAAALAAFYHHVPVVHVEAGLRTGDPRSPYPEEINRRLTTQLTDLHLAPTPLGRANLLREGIAEQAIRVTGNTVIDAFLEVTARGSPVGEQALDTAIDEQRRILLVTAHRRESWGSQMVGIGRGLAVLARDFPDVLVALPIHRNPIVREQLLPPLDGLPNVVVTEPLGYSSFSALIAASTVVLTDSGGIQEEAPSLGKPVLVMRDHTERPEGITAGTAALVGTDEDDIVRAVSRLLSDAGAYQTMARAVNPFGDGRAGTRSVAAIESMLGFRAPMPDFAPLAAALS